MYKHGHAKVGKLTKTYRIWHAMRKRCNNPNDSFYHAYGGRGIRVCPEWDSDYNKFLADMGECPEGHSIERKDNDRGYEPSNCKWIPMGKQARNRRTNRVVEFGGKSMTVTEWGEQTGLGESCIRQRLNLGWTVEKALTTPLISNDGNRHTAQSKFIEYEGRTITIAELAHEKGIAPRTLHNRLRIGWDIERALREPVRVCIRSRQNRGG